MPSRIPETILFKGFREFYEVLINKTLQTFKSGNYEKTLEMVSATAYFAWNYHSGVFSETKLEQIILKIGQQLDTLAAAPNQITFNVPKNKNTKQILHIATELYDVGGHSRLITSWIENDSANTHSLVITNQDIADFPGEFNKTINNNGGQVELLSKNESILDRAAVLREISRQFDFVILHIHPDDVIPLIAFATENSPPVALMNHADHVFWLGASIADLVIDLRNFGRNLTINRRKGRKSLILPIPLTIPREEISREEARQKLSIKDEQVVMLSIGSEYKYVKSNSKDFSETGKKILDKNPHALLYVIGPKPNEERFQKHERMKFLGVVQNPILYQKAADIYLEGFPFSSFTALLETVSLNVCPVLMYSPSQIGAFDIEMGLSNCELNTVDEDDYIDKVTELINQPCKRRKIAAQVKSDVLEYHCGDIWHKYLNEIYDYLEKINHKPELIEETLPLEQDEDLYLVEMKNNQLQFLKYPIWLDMCSQPKILKWLNFSDILVTFYKSWQNGDTKSLLDIVRWRHALFFNRF